MGRRRNKRYAERLGRVVESLPFETQRAMLDGLHRYDRIIAGAYSDRQGGVCPMLAAHRCGGRTDYRSFARAWDRFTGATRHARPVTERELRTLTAQLETSVMAEEHRRELARLARESAERAAQQHEEHRTGKVRRRRSSKRVRDWLGPFRRWDRYRDTVSRVSTALEDNGLIDLREGKPQQPTTELERREAARRRADARELERA